MSKPTKMEKDINSIIDNIIENTPIISGKFYFKQDVLEEKSSELAAILNEKFKAQNGGVISGYDLSVIYINTIEQRGAADLLGPVRDFSFGRANELSAEGKSLVHSALNTNHSKDYSVTLAIKNYSGKFDLTGTELNDIGVAYDEGNKILTVEVNVKGYCDLKNRFEKFYNYSCIESALYLYKALFCYLSFFKETIHVGEEYDIEQEFELIIVNGEDKQTFPLHSHDTVLTIYPCHTEYDTRFFQKTDINQKMITLLLGHEYLKLSFEWFMRAIYANDYDTKIVMICVAFEGLYGKHNRTKEQAKTRDTYMLKAVYFLAASQSEREQFSKILSDLFDCRNKIVHADIENLNEVTKVKLFHRARDLFQRCFNKELSIH